MDTNWYFYGAGTGVLKKVIYIQLRYFEKGYNIDTYLYVLRSA